MSTPFATYPAPERPFIQSNFIARGNSTTASKTTKRGRKPKNESSNSARNSPALASQHTPIQWATIQSAASPNVGSEQEQLSSETGAIVALPTIAESSSTPTRELSQAPPRASVSAVGITGAEDDVEGEDEMLPAMADDDYSAQLSWQSQSKDNLKSVHLVYSSFPEH